MMAGTGFRALCVEAGMPPETPDSGIGQWAVMQPYLLERLMEAESRIGESHVATELMDRG